MRQTPWLYAASCLLLLVGCAGPSWDNPHLQDPASKARQLSVDSDYCELVGARAAPMPDVRVYTPGQQTYAISGRATSYNAHSGYTTSRFSGTAQPTSGGFAQGMSEGMAQGAALGAMLAARRDRDRIVAACMRSLGWVDGQPSAGSTAAHSSKDDTSTDRHRSAALQAVEAAIAANPKLAYLRQHDADTFGKIARIDTMLLEQPDWAGRPLAERFDMAVRMYEAAYGQIDIPGRSSQALGR
jgi:hypothetical protein